MVRIIACCGAGGTGKTSVVTAIRDLLGPDTVTLHGSIVRAFYAQEGLAGESAFVAMDLHDKLAFQFKFLKAYIAAFEQAVEDCPTPILLADRSIYDHIAYVTYWGSLAIDESMWSFQIEALIARFLGLQPHVVRFPMPHWWSARIAADGFRYNSYGKEWTLDALMHRLVGVYHPLPLASEVLAEGDARQRAKRIIDELWLRGHCPIPRDAGMTVA